MLDKLYSLAEVEKEQISFVGIDGSEQQYTYKEYFARVSSLASLLNLNGVKESHVLAIVLPSREFFSLAFLSSLLMGATPCALYPPMRMGKYTQWKEQFIQQIKTLRPHFLLTNKLLVGIVKKTLAEAKISLPLFLEEDFKLSSSMQSFPTRKKSSLAFAQFSSGTTGFSKALSIELSHLESNIKAILSALDEETKQGNCVNWCPLYHDMGLVGGFLSTLYQKRPLTLIPPEYFLARPFLWPQKMSEKKATITMGPNFALGLCSEKISDEDVQKIDLSALRVILCGAETVLPRTWKKFYQKFSKANLREESLTPVYGMAEATLAVSFSDVADKPHFRTFSHGTYASLGRALEGIHIDIVNEKGESVGEEEVGEIALSGSSLVTTTQGHPYYLTGDRGFLYKEELYFVSRKKEVIILCGKNFSPYWAEEKIGEIPGVRTGTVMVLGITDEKEGDSDQIVVCMELQKEGEVQKEQIEALVKNVIYESFSHFPKNILFFEKGSLPRTSSGKLKRAFMKEALMKKEKVCNERFGVYKAFWDNLSGKFFQRDQRSS